jgi:ATP/maltotriose-dependent transcriptional regulator MalT
MSLESGDQDTARARADEALSISRALGDPFDVAHAEFLVANVAASNEDYDRARQLLEPARERFKELGARHYTLLSTRVLAWALAELGDTATADALHHENLQMARAYGNKRIEAMTLGALAYRAIDDGRLDEAATLLRDSYRMDREQGDLMAMASHLFTLARLLAHADRAEDATRMLARSASAYEEVGAAIPAYDTADREVAIARIRQRLSDAEYELAWSRGRTLGAAEIDAILDDLVSGG